MPPCLSCVFMAGGHHCGYHCEVRGTSVSPHMPHRHTWWVSPCMAVTWLDSHGSSMTASTRIVYSLLAILSGSGKALTGLIGKSTHWPDKLAVVVLRACRHRETSCIYKPKLGRGIYTQHSMATHVVGEATATPGPTWRHPPRSNEQHAMTAGPVYLVNCLTGCQIQAGMAHTSFDAQG